MALVLKNGALFLHIPKTGGNWVTKVLEESELVVCEMGHKHCHLDRMYSPQFRRPREALKHFARRLRFHATKPRDPFIFCFVRNPLSWYESWFKYMSQPSRQWRHWGDELDHKNWHPNAMLNGMGADDFNQFVSNVVARRPGYVTELFGWYTDARVNFIGKQESLADDLVKALKEMNVSFDEDLIRNRGRVGASPTPESGIEWDPELREKVLKLEHAAMVRYGYEPSADVAEDAG